MATDLERLVVNLEAKITQYEKSMNKALGISNQRAKQVEARWAKLNLGREAFSGLAKGALAGILPALSLAAAINKTKDALKDFGDIADRAATAGLDPEFFQGVTEQAKLSGVSLEESGAALGVFAKNSGLAEAGIGKMATALKTLNPTLLESLQNAKSQEERVRLMADALASITDPAQRAAVAVAAFGDSGKDIARAFEGGSRSIDEFIAKGKEIGIIVSRDLIERADELGDKFDTAARIVDLQLKQAFINAAPGLVSLINLAGELLLTFNSVVDSFKSIEDRQFTIPLQNELIAVENQIPGTIEKIADLQKELDGMADGSGMRGIAKLGLDDAEAELDALYAKSAAINEQLAKLFGMTSDGTTSATTKPSGPSAEDAAAAAAVFDQTRTAAERYAAEIERLDALLASGALTQETYDRAVAAAKDDLDASNKTKVEAARLTVQQAEALKGLLADLEFERKIVGLSALDQEVMNAARQAGVDVMSEEGLKLREKITLLNEERDAQDKVNEALKTQSQVAQEAGRSLAEALRDGKLEGMELLDILADVVRQIALAGLKDAVDSGNIGASILSGLLSGFASGTSNTGGARGQVRGLVHGQEAVIPLPSGGRVPVELRMPALPANGNGAQKVSHNVYNYGTDPVRTETNQSGGIDVIIGEVDRQLASGKIGGGFARRFGLRHGTRRS
ncbi:MAG: hypothetical protein ABL866_14120 [Devosia sp.]